MSGVFLQQRIIAGVAEFAFEIRRIIFHLKKTIIQSYCYTTAVVYNFKTNRLFKDRKWIKESRMS